MKETYKRLIQNWQKNGIMKETKDSHMNIDQPLVYDAQYRIPWIVFDRGENLKLVKPNTLNNIYASAKLLCYICGYAERSYTL